MCRKYCQKECKMVSHPSIHALLSVIMRIAWKTVYTTCDKKSNLPAFVNNCLIIFSAISSEVLEFSDVCRYYLGRWAEVIAFISSLLTLLGGMIVYWILISNFLYNIVAYIYRKFLSQYCCMVNGYTFRENSSAIFNFVSLLS